MRTSVFAALVLLLAGCSARDGVTLGTLAPGQPVSVASLQQASVDAPVVLTGTMKTKCPAAGCWFMLHDQTGMIKVDTKNSGFVVVDVPLNSRLTVAGRITTNDSGRIIDATGVRY